jgi:opacity protein-like surface antigen
MKAILAAVVLTMALLSPAFAGDGQGQNGQGQNGNGLRGAPVPLMGAGLPGLAIGIGYGVYWLVRRRRNVG